MLTPTIGPSRTKEDFAQHFARVLTSMATRNAFLEDATHRIRFVYPQRYASWLNQVELWSSILSEGGGLKSLKFRQNVPKTDDDLSSRELVPQLRPQVRR